MTDSPSEIELPDNLEARVLAQFDDLLKKGEIFYEPSSPDYVIDKGFQFEFRIIPFLSDKPISAPESPSRTRPSGPFIKPRESEVVTNVGSAHRLLLNKYCVYRPMLVLPTTEFALQTDDLDMNDITAAWTVLKAIASPYMVIYNCGAGAGSSLGHKHLQLFPLPDTAAMTLFPSRASKTKSVDTAILDVPFQHFVSRLKATATSLDVFATYKSLLLMTREAHRAAATGPDYNVVFTAEWMALIPRQTVNFGGPQGANAAGMVGMVGIPNQEHRRQWAERGYTEYLKVLGLEVP